MKPKGKVKGVLCALISLILTVWAVLCVGVRMSQFPGSAENAVITAAALTISRGSFKTEASSESTEEKNKEKNTRSAAQTEPVPTQGDTSSDFSPDYYNTYADHSGCKKYPVYTKQYRVGGKKYRNFYVKNNTSFDLDIGKALKEEPGFTLENTDEVQVLIYHTHTGESYLDCDAGYYYSDYYPRTTDNRYNVTRVGKAIAQELKKAGIGVVHDTSVHDSSYTGSYRRSRETVEKYLKKYPKIKVTLDIHRDAIGSDTYKVKPTFTYKGKKGAQIMIMAGCDLSGELDFPKWKYNLGFALRLQQACETSFGGMTRPLDFGNFAYNMNVNTGSLLVEVGTDSNTLEEAVYSGKLLGKGLVTVLQNDG